MRNGRGSGSVTTASWISVVVGQRRGRYVRKSPTYRTLAIQAATVSRAVSAGIADRRYPRASRYSGSMRDIERRPGLITRLRTASWRDLLVVGLPTLLVAAVAV